MTKKVNGVVDIGYREWMDDLIKLPTFAKKYTCRLDVCTTSIHVRGLAKLKTRLATNLIFHWEEGRSLPAVLVLTATPETAAVQESCSLLFIFEGKIARGAPNR